MRKKLVILSGLIAVNSLSYASGYDWQTPTENNWHVVIANGEMNYADGTILGGNGTASAPEPSVISLRIRVALQKLFPQELLI